MKSLAAVFLFSLIAAVVSLKYRQPQKGKICIAPSCDVPKAPQHQVRKSVVVAAKTTGNASHAVAGKLVWVVGSSIDSNAVKDSCNNAQATVIDLDPAVPNQIFWCVLPTATLVFSFHPGWTPGPYYDAYGTIMTTTSDILTSRSAQILTAFGKHPDVTVMDSSMWDVANWWQKAGKPNDWPVPTAEISNWCEATVPAFLKFMQTLLPQTHIFYRSPPPAFATTWMPWTLRIDQVMVAMHGCLVSKLSGGLVYGSFAFVDFFKVAQAQAVLTGGNLRALYKDELHPGAQLSVAYIADVLQRL